jgi:glycosyltransferase involved in cell wall biosynthesis
MTNKTNQPLVTIITPVFNGSELIEKCYNSIVKQDYHNIEWVIVDDGSTDNSKEVIESLQAKEIVSIKYIKQENKGACAARKKAIFCASGAYIVNIDCDDYLSTNAVSLSMKQMLGNDEIDFVLFNLFFINLDGTKQKPFEYFANQWPIRGEVALSQCLSEWKIHGLGAVKKDIYIKAYQLLGEESQNNVNTDELLTRYLFHYCNRVDISQGSYFYVNNINSTTKSININGYKVINNAIRLSDFIDKNYPHLKNNCQNNLLSTAWVICYSLAKNYTQLNNKKDWLNAVLLANNHIDFKGLKIQGEDNLLSKVKFFIKIISVKIIGNLGRI